MKADNHFGCRCRTRLQGGEIAQSACRFLEALVATALGTGIRAIRAGERGNAAEALARQTAMYMAHVSLGLSLSQVGANFGRDRTTVAHACQRVEDRREDPAFERTIACLESAFERWRTGAGGVAE